MKKLLKKALVLPSFLFLFCLPNQLNARQNNDFIGFLNKQNYAPQPKTFQQDKKQKQLTDVLIESLTEKLLENKFFLTYDPNQDDEQKSDQGPELKSAEIEDIYALKREILNRSLVDAVKETLSKTSLGKKIKKLEKNIAKFFILEYSKENSQSKACFYLPGQLSASQIDKKKLYKFSLSSSFYQKPNSAMEDFSIGLKGEIYDSKMNFTYDLYKKGINFNFKTGNLKSFFNTQLYFYAKSYKEEEITGLGLSINF